MGGFFGNQSATGGLEGVDIAVCTIEKANNMVNRLLEDDNLHLIGQFGVTS